MKVSLDTIASFAKRKGFVYPGSEIYGGLAGTFDYGPLGLALKQNIERLWWKRFVDLRDDMYGIDSAVLMNPKVWETSGHVEGFNDPMVDCIKCHKRQRADQLIEEQKELFVQKINDYLQEKATPAPKKEGDIGISMQYARGDMQAVDKALVTYTGPFTQRFLNEQISCPNCKAKQWSEPQQFNMMFKTSVGSVEGGEMAVYLRPETAQGMFVNFKNIIDSFHPKLPFGIAQIGRSFRNEIAPREFLFRVRELEIMEFEYFIRESDWEERFEYWMKEMREWFRSLGFKDEDVKEVEVPEGERAHYSKRTTDFYFNYPGGYKEIGGLAYRTDYDLSKHIEATGEELRYLDPDDNQKLIPHVLEPTFGLGRHVLAVLVNAYDVDELGGEERIVLRLPFNLAPVKVMVSPLLKNKPELVAKAREVREMLRKVHPAIAWDDNGNIGKRYRRQDEIGTPWCVTIDFDTLEDGTVTIRDRDTGEQVRLSVEAVVEKLRSVL